MALFVVRSSAAGVRVLPASFTTCVHQKHTLADPSIQQQKYVHQTRREAVPTAAPAAMLPANVEELNASEKAKFSPQRSRDVSSKLNQVGGVFSSGFMGDQGCAGSSSFNTGSSPVDCHMEVYDAHNTVSLSSVMQTNVPKPFGITGKAPVHLNMPGGQWAQGDKYVSGDLHTCHHANITAKKKSGIGPLKQAGLRLPVNCVLSRLQHRGLTTWCGGGRIDSLFALWLPSSANTTCFANKQFSGSRCVSGVQPHLPVRCLHQSSVWGGSNSSSPAQPQLTSRQKLQRAVKEYGSTVIVFHVAISLLSLGICYLLVSSGVDMTGLMQKLGLKLGPVGQDAGDSQCPSPTPPQQTPEAELSGSEEDGGEKVLDLTTQRAAGAATFVIAYAVHKVFAPVRIATTLTATPFIVRHLRKIGFLKPPKPIN